MSQHYPSYSAKLLLFGEYSILLGSSALSIPYHHYHAELCFIHQKKYTELKQAEKSQQLLLKWLDFMEKAGIYNELLDLPLLKKDLINGLYLESGILQCYGLGSSGAVVAAVYSRYAINKINSISITIKEMEILREIFSSMESFFHGISSGIDPLTIYINQPLYISKDKITSIVEIPQSWQRKSTSIFLIDTNSKGKTNSLVPVFLNQIVGEEKMKAATGRLISLTDNCIQHFLSGSNNDFSQSIYALSQFQLQYLHKLIPEKMLGIWKNALEDGDIMMKLCGSGGGGYLLAFASSHDKALEFFKHYELAYITVNILR